MIGDKGYSDKISNLPITPYLDEICTALKNSPSHFLILTAETAAGKSTAMPLALLKNFTSEQNNRGIVMLEPRRLAVINIATRVAELLGEEVGETCGYQMHLENNTSAKTKFTVLTEAILTRKLQSDPSLDNVSVVVIDEFHERSIHADLALAFLKETMALRDDLFVIVMSATINTEQVSKYLGIQKEDGTFTPAPLFFVPGRQYPVAISYKGNCSASEAIVSEVRNNSSDEGSILVFLPGISEIRRTQAELESAGIGSNEEILILHSSIDFIEQRRILKPSASSFRRRIILSSAIAETSLTVPDVTVVIDSGLSRINVMNRASGMETLVTRSESLFNAEQRAGRAGRISPGRCIRLWNESDVRSTEIPPEILRTDLTQLVLECAEWGVDSPKRLSWLDEPPLAVWEQTQQLLIQLGCISKDLLITQLGKAALSLGIHPRLACVALRGIFFGTEAECMGIEQAVKYSSYADSSPVQKKLFKQELQQRIGRAKNIFFKEINKNSKKYSPAIALLAGYPDRIAIRTDVSQQKRDAALYQFPSGRMAMLIVESHEFPEYIIAPETDAGERTGRIYSWEAISSEDAVSWLNEHALTYIETRFAGSKLDKKEITSYGKILLKTRKLQAEPQDYVQAVCTAVAEQGISWLPLDLMTKNLLLRVQFYVQEKKSDDAVTISQKYKTLVFDAEKWLVPFIPQTNKISSVTEKQVYDALYWYLDGVTIDKTVPIELTLPNGRKRKIVYEEHEGKITPVLEIIIQQIFGCMETPKVLGMPVLLKLLSPARRPLQITDDLEHFWQNTWPEICKEMKGRYPKHNWDYRVVSKED